MNRTQKALKMVIGSIINQGMIVIVGLILPPLIISKYGSSINGLVNSVKQMLSYFSVISVGLGAAGQVALYEPLAKKEQTKINAIMSELTAFFNKMSYVFGILIGILAFILPIIRKDEIDAITVFFIVLICGAGSLIEFNCLQKYKILLVSDQKQYITSSVNSQGLLINLICSVILIQLNAPIIIVQLMATLAYVVRVCLMTIKIQKMYPELNIKEKVVDKKIKNQKEALLYKTSDIIINYAPMTIVTIMYGFVDASIYSVYNTIFMSVGMIVNIFSSGFSSFFGNKIVEKDDKSIKDSFIGYSFVFRTILFWFYCCSAVLIVPFVSVYINNNDGVNYLIPILGIMFAVNGIFKAIRTPSVTIIDALGKYNKKNIVLNYVEVSLNIIISIWGAIKFGITGVLIGGAIAALFRSICFIIDVFRENLKISCIKEFFKLILNFVLFIILYYLLNRIYVENFLQWIISAIYVACISGICFLLINITIDKNAFIEFFKRFKGLLKKGEKSI